MRGNAKGPLLIAATAILWSFGGLLIKLIPWNAMTIVGTRAIFAAVVLAIYMRRPRIHFTPSVILGGLCMSGTTILFVFANKLTTAANAIVLQYTAPIFIIILSMVFLKKKPKPLDFAAVLIVFFGIGLFFFDQLKGSALLGNLLACMSGVTFAGVFLINQMPNAKPEEALLLGHLINIAVGLPFILTNLTFEPVALLSITLLGVFQLGIAYVLFSIGIKLTPPISASLIASLEPLLNPVWVFLLTGERPGVWALVGGAIVLVTVVLYNLASMKQGKKAAQTAGNPVADATP
jgi:drug/metabolite transporter (DMT)-like permease